MKDIIERMMAIEKRAKKILEEAERDSQKILEEARDRIRRRSEEARSKAVEEAQKFFDEEVAKVQKQKALQLEKSRLESQRLRNMPPQKKKKALEFVIESLAGGSTLPPSS